MNPTRTAAIVVVGGGLAAWLYAAVVPERHAPALAPAPRPAAADLDNAQLAIEIARLQERLRPDALPRRPSRDLFAFRRAPAPRVRPAEAASSAPSEPIANAARPQPALKLAGIAEDPGDDGPVRTAIISGEGQLFLVKQGDTVTSRYRVSRISPDVVELIDLDDDSIRRLALR